MKTFRVVATWPADSSAFALLLSADGEAWIARSPNELDVGLEMPMDCQAVVPPIIDFGFDDVKPLLCPPPITSEMEAYRATGVVDPSWVDYVRGVWAEGFECTS